MAYFDVFNGDADGICALAQLRNANPVDSTLITGVKRDISLLKQVIAATGDVITVLDVSMDKNKQALSDCLDAGAEIFYCDHHATGDIPEHAALTPLINLESNICTSLLVNAHLNGEFALWAIVGAFGDNLKDSAVAVAKPLGLSEAQLTDLENLGIYINYNGYGATIEDLHFAPADLYREIVKFASPFDFMANNKDVYEKLANGYAADMAKVEAISAYYEQEHAAVFVLPNEKWARRVSGVYSNDLANNHVDRAHAVLTEKSDGNFLVSVRAPLTNKQGAVDICSQFATGGGRAAAAGINDLPADQVDAFIDVFQRFYHL
ncbi:MAG: DHH family phosphoesterase [Pseudomonadales bacterium]|nr:DHH family phosphoesterase [Pseudomonadales bacterium]